MSTLIIIPARMESSRFPGKPLAKIAGITMIEHVYNRAKNLGVDVIVATCNSEIDHFIKKIGGKSVMTKRSHFRATDRCAEAVIKYDKKYKQTVKYVIMVQGDEPIIKKKMILSVIKEIKKNKYDCVNLYSYISSKKEFLNPDCIKVVTDNNNICLYMSRMPIPYYKFLKKDKIKKQVCVIGFKRKSLIKYHSLKETFLENKESIDMLRFLENNIKIKMLLTKETSHAVDRKKDIKKIEELLRADATYK